METIKVGDKVRHKNDHEYNGIVTKISIPQTYHARKNDIRFIAIDGILTGSTIDMWEKYETK
jgi:hypothetical protein